MIHKSQIFTPPEYVQKLLNSIEYKDNIYGKKVIDNSCGSGNILVEIVQRYINDGIGRGFSISDIKNQLQEDIYGFEIDPTYFKKCIINLDKIAGAFGICGVKWNVTNTNSLQHLYVDFFDYG